MEPGQEHEARQHRRRDQDLREHRHERHGLAHVPEEPVELRQRGTGKERHHVGPREARAERVGGRHVVGPHHDRRDAGRVGWIEGRADPLARLGFVARGKAVDLPHALDRHQDRPIPRASDGRQAAHHPVCVIAMRALLDSRAVAVGGLDLLAKRYRREGARHGLLVGREEAALGQRPGEVLHEGGGGADHRGALVAVAEGDGGGQGHVRVFHDLGELGARKERHVGGLEEHRRQHQRDLTARGPRRGRTVRPPARCLGAARAPAR